MMKRFLAVVATLIATLLAVSAFAQTASDARNVGDKAPNFTLINASGDKVSLYDELEKGPVVLTWYRGAWCPYCNRSLAEFQEHLSEIEGEGATLMAISGQLPDKSLTVKDKNALKFNVLSDPMNKVGKKYKIIFDLDAVTHARYNDKINFDSFYSDDSGQLPIPATYIIGQDRIIKYAFIDEDYTKRADPMVVVSELEKLN